jgi:hypothetical protein
VCLLGSVHLQEHRNSKPESTAVTMEMKHTQKEKLWYSNNFMIQTAQQFQTSNMASNMRHITGWQNP